MLTILALPLLCTQLRGIIVKSSSGFLLTRAEAQAELKARTRSAEVLFPFLTAEELLGNVDSLPDRYVVDFGDRSLLDAREYKLLFARVEGAVLADRKRAAKEEEVRTSDARAADVAARVNRHHANFLAHWWQLSYARSDLMAAIRGIDRYIVCGRVTKRPIFEFVSSAIHPNDALTVFPFADDYSFGVLQSSAHWEWFTARCSTLEERPRYTSNTVFDTFAWPQAPSAAEVRAVATAAVELRRTRRELMHKHKLSLRELYRQGEKPGKHPIREAHTALDAAVRAAYGMPTEAEALAFLIDLNHAVAARERRGEPVTGPGLPARVANPERLVTADCVRMP